MKEKLNNPLFNIPEKKNIVLASMKSPVSNQDMILCNIKSIDGKNIPAWVCLEDRVCLPVLKKN